MLIRKEKVQYDWLIIASYFSLILIGSLAIYAVTFPQNIDKTIFDLSAPISRHLLFLVIALSLFSICLLVDWKVWHNFSYIIYAFSIALLILVLLIGSEIKGAKAWIEFGGFSIQPSELAKLGTALALSSFLSFHKTNLKYRNYQLIAIGIIALPMFFILMQPDAGSAITFLAFFIVLYIEGLNTFYYVLAFLFLTVFILSFLFPFYYILFGLLFIALCMVWFYKKNFSYNISLLVVSLCVSILLEYLFPLMYYSVGFTAIVLFIMLIFVWKERNERISINAVILIAILSFFSFATMEVFKSLEPHQQERIKVWLKPSECDPRGSLYNVLQSKVAIGSGGLVGKGFLEGNMTKFKYVPEQSTDFIFSTIGEEQGFIGCVLVIGIFILLIYRTLSISASAPHKFISYYASCIAGLLIIHMSINIGMTIGLFPIIGIPLPFISKGGTALISFSMMLGILLRMQTHAK